MAVRREVWSVLASPVSPGGNECQMLSPVSVCQCSDSW